MGLGGTVERKGKTVTLVLSRQNLPRLEKNQGREEFNRGAYIVFKEEKERPDMVLVASGSETMSLAVETGNFLKKKNISFRVVSIPDREEFLSQDERYIENILGPKDVLRAVIEVNKGQDWYQLLKEEYLAIFMETFDKSAPGKEVADYFGFSPRKIADKIMEMVL